MTDELIVATRKSKLALWQAEFIAARLRALHPGLSVHLQPMSTQGDRWLSSPLSEVGGKGLFIKELESAMLDGRAHIAVHSMKDVPAVLPEGFVLGAVGFRSESRDVLVAPGGLDLDSLPAGARVGSASLRRQALLRARRPDLHVRPVRGNVGTRLDKLDAGEFDALVLAMTGLQRLGLGERISAVLEPEWCVPAVGQGALGIECRADDTQTLSLLAGLDDAQIRACVTAERALSAGLDAGCSTPLGGHACWRDQDLELRAALGRVDGSQVLRATANSATDAALREPEALGAAVAADLMQQGAGQILAELDDAH